MGSNETLDELGKELACLKLAMFKHSITYKKNFFETVEEDAEDIFIFIKEIYEEKKNTNESYIPLLGKFVIGLEKYFK